MNTYSQLSTRQAGTAVISALLIAAVVAVIAAGMLTRQRVFTRSLEAQQCHAQGRAVLQGGLEASRQLLWASRQQEVLTRLDQPWARPIRFTSSNVLLGPFEGRLVDQQGKFNLRNLLTNERVDVGQLRSFARLCEMIGIDTGLGQRISQRVIASYPRVMSPPAARQDTAPSHLASDRPTSAGVARQPLPATRPMLRTLEGLRDIQGMNERVLARLEQFVSIIPANTWVNANTASAEVLASVVPGLSLSQAQAVVAERDSGLWFINRGDFVNRLHLPHLSVDGLNVGITSEWFLLQGQARCDRRRLGINAFLHRPQEQRPQVIWSRLGV
ncbi:type II secretion system minor pseudopilin GspK [Pseudomonas asplenii]|uniref:type II secretion system minor pseudopilin GspK n=1 Tax=Pseudomonas asplenii TaxID=53407 RepID=UPI002360F505|nr:type II secretion system minor pseudopilin GspK [Pseudomonas asplenii]